MCVLIPFCMHAFMCKYKYNHMCACRPKCVYICALVGINFILIALHHKSQICLKGFTVCMAYNIRCSQTLCVCARVHACTSVCVHLCINPLYLLFPARKETYGRFANISCCRQIHSCVYCITAGVPRCKQHLFVY